MKTSNSSKAADPNTAESDRILSGSEAAPWEPLANNEDEEGEHTTDVDPEI